MKNEKIIVALLVAICLISTIAIGMPNPSAKYSSNHGASIVEARSALPLDGGVKCLEV